MLGPVVCDIAGTTLSEAEVKRIAHPLVGMVILFTATMKIECSSKNSAAPSMTSSPVF